MPEKGKIEQTLFEVVHLVSVVKRVAGGELNAVL